MKKLRLKQWVKDMLGTIYVIAMFTAITIVAFKVYGII